MTLELIKQIDIALVIGICILIAIIWCDWGEQK